MNWVVFSYSLPSKSSSPRVSAWRQLQRLGAVSVAGGVYLLPSQEACVEAFEWLAQKVKQAGGDALVMHVQRFEGITDQELIGLFRQARQADYAAIDAQAAQIEDVLQQQEVVGDNTLIENELDKLQRQYADITRIDYFECPEKSQLAARLARIRRRLFPEAFLPVEIAPVAVDAYRDKRWITRPRPHVDRLACMWLIRRFINPDAVIRYASEPELDEIAFDMSGGEFSHRGNLCTFETMLRAFELDDPALHTMAEVVHEIDLRDGLYMHLETNGVDALLQGWQLVGLSDQEMESRGLALFDGLYAALTGHSVPVERSAK